MLNDATNSNRIIAHIDMNSYFASVEQQARPKLRGKPIAVTGSNKKRTIIVAASVEAKRYGIKTGTPVWEARNIYPNIALVSADCKRYESISKQFLEIFISKTAEVEIFSIDEAFLDLTGRVRNFKDAQTIVKSIKSEISLKIGDSVRCSAGLAQNKFMAKLASEAKKPDGLTVVFPDQEIEFLDRFKLEDACGIGSRILRRLNRIGIYSFKDLRKKDLTELTLNFGSYGLRLFRMARGEDFDPVKPFYLKRLPKSISRSKTVEVSIKNKDILNKMILSFSQVIGSDLRRKKLLATSSGVYLRFDGFSSWFNCKKIKTPTNSTTDIYQNSCCLLSDFDIRVPIRKVGIVAGGLVVDKGQEFLFESDRKKRGLEEVVDNYNFKSGQRMTIFSSSLCGFGFNGETPNYGFKKDYLE